jgi:hypothetical protein
MNVPTRSELARALARIETLEREVARLKAKPRGRPAPKAPSRRPARAAKPRPAPTGE